MGHSYTAICRKCGREFSVREGGGFFFHLLHCDKCGKQKAVRFEELGEMHLKYIKGLECPYSTVSAAMDKNIQANYAGEPISEDEYHSAVEQVAGQCECGGNYSIAAKPRCPKCHSTDFEDSGKGTIFYD